LPATRACEDCAFIQATGEITPQTPALFEAFIKQKDFWPKIVRFNSPGGNLGAGIELGQILRANGVSTEVGSDEADPEAAGGTWVVPATKRVPGICASACAYAFMGGIDRQIEPGSKIGLHRFYEENALLAPTAKLFTGADLDEAQKIAAALVFYSIQMGVDPLVISVAAEAGPDDVRWVEAAEGADLKLAYKPHGWKPWHIETYKNGVIAVSETNDAKVEMVAPCSRRSDPKVMLIDRSTDSDVGQWFEGNRTCTSAHPVFGTLVKPDHINVARVAGGASISFHLPTATPPLDSPAIFPRDPDIYAIACSTDSYGGSRVNFKPAVSVAFRNCIE
jgi:hypothetical protein